MFKKINLVTLKDRKGYFDLLQCEECGHKIKRYGLSDLPPCPKCLKKKIKKYGRDLSSPIWGGWTTAPLHDGSHKCYWCKSQAIVVPKEGHPNSKFWPMQREKNEYLFCCPLGCTEDGSYIVIRRRA